MIDDAHGISFPSLCGFPFAGVGMRRPDSLRVTFVLALVFASVSHAVAEQAVESEVVDDICAPLRLAEPLYSSLQPKQWEHLESKVGKWQSTIHHLPSRGWGDGLGLSHDGPLATTLRLLPRLVSLLSPSNWIGAIKDAVSSRRQSTESPRGGTVRISRGRKDKIEKLMSLLGEAEARGCVEAHKFRAKMLMFPPKNIRQDLIEAREHWEVYVDRTGDAEGQFILGFFHASGLAGVPQDQAKALLYYTFAALGGYRPAEMVLGYRHWAGIGVKEDCMTAMEYYESAAEKAYAHFLSGPPGGRSLLLTPTRLSDTFGGIYGSHASWASTGINSFRAAIKSSSAVARGETEREILEYYQYNSDRDAHDFTVYLGRLYYLGSVHFLGGGIANGADGVGEIPRDYRKAKEYFHKVARAYWPVDWLADGSVAPPRKMSKEHEAALRKWAGVAASFLGRMAMRGEGSSPDYKRGRMWYERAAELGERESLNGLGIIHRDGLLTLVDTQKAYQYFQAAAGLDLAEAQTHLAKIHLDRNEIPQATELLTSALQHGAQFEPFHLLAHAHATAAHAAAAAGAHPGTCGVAVAWFKIVSERGSWQDDYIGEADRAWARGEADKAMLGWWIAGEMGFEAGQNNIAYQLSLGKVPGWLRNATDETRKERELEMWVRSAAQDNVDSMVKVGDYFCVGVNYESRFERAANYYQTAADTQMSAMAYWNLGWMYESGEGVPQDWHLAKRYYDLSYEASSEAYLPVMLSLTGLYLRSWWTDLRTGGAVPGLSLFEPDEETLTTWDRIKLVWTPGPAVLDEDGEGEGVQDYSGNTWAGDDAQGLEEDDLLETVFILSLGALVMGLVYLRGRWARDQRGQRQDPHPAANGWAEPADAAEAARADAALARGEVERPRDDGLPVGWEPPIP